MRLKYAIGSIIVCLLVVGLLVGGLAIAKKQPVPQGCPEADGLKQCGDKCINIMNDPENCGGCGAPCDEGEICQGGVCQPSFCTKPCDDGKSCTDDFCEKGKCNNPVNCLGEKVCGADGSCVCPEGLKDCGGTCQQCCAPDDCLSIMVYNPCQEPTCDAGACGLQNKPNGVLCPDGKCCEGTCISSSACCEHSDCEDIEFAWDACTDGVCTHECYGGYGNCDGDFANGCEIQFGADPNCGGCGLSCPDNMECAMYSVMGGICCPIGGPYESPYCCLFATGEPGDTCSYS